MKTEYEIVIGLEVHAQLLTKSKLFCGDSTVFGAAPNTQVSPVTLAHPGTLPKMNKAAIEYAVKMGIACNAEIAQQNYFARKNYFYPDLPKGYQVSQHTTPICQGGYVIIHIAGEEKKIRLNRIHMEEDAGKSIHDIDDAYTAIDLNRAGTPLIEIVTEPDLRSADEAFAYLTEIRKLVRYLSICDGNMEEGSLRCDANVSVRKKGEAKLGTKVEVKNLNSIRNVKRAIESEAQRLMTILDEGGTVMQQTRSFDAATGTTFSIREKEDADDYRYFPEPDLPPFHLSEKFIESIRNTIPELPQARAARFINELQLPAYDSQLIADDLPFAEYFEAVIGKGAAPKASANWMLGPVRTWMNERSATISEFPLSAQQLAAIILLVSENKLSFSAASGKLLQYLLDHPDVDPEKAATELNILQESGSDTLLPVIEAVIEKYPEKVAEYKQGKKGLLAMFVGEVMKRSNGKADPKVVNELLIKHLK